MTDTVEFCVDRSAYGAGGLFVVVKTIGGNVGAINVVIGETPSYPEAYNIAYKAAYDECVARDWSVFDTRVGWPEWDPPSEDEIQFDDAIEDDADLPTFPPLSHVDRPMLISDADGELWWVNPNTETLRRAS